MISGSLFFYQNWLTFLLARWLSFLLTKARIYLLELIYIYAYRSEGIALYLLPSWLLVVIIAVRNGIAAAPFTAIVLLSEIC